MKTLPCKQMLEVMYFALSSNAEYMLLVIEKKVNLHLRNKAPQERENGNTQLDRGCDKIN